jgi:hypothetical protein
MLSNSIDPTEKPATTQAEAIDLLWVFVCKVITCADIDVQDAPKVQ